MRTRRSKAIEFTQQHCVDRQGFRDRFQGRMATDKLLDAPQKALRRDWPDLQGEATQNAAQPHFHVVKLRLNELPRRQQSAHS